MSMIIEIVKCCCLVTTPYYIYTMLCKWCEKGIASLEWKAGKPIKGQVKWLGMPVGLLGSYGTKCI
jgi:hypothetical protein